MGKGSNVTEMYYQGSNSDELKEVSLSGQLKGQSCPKVFSWTNVFKISIDYFIVGLSWNVLFWAFLTLTPWEKIRQINKKNETYGFYLLAYVAALNSSSWYQTQILGSGRCWILESEDMQLAAGSSKNYPASSRVSSGFPGESRGAGEEWCESARPLLCRVYLYSAGLFAPLMTATISPGAFWGSLSKLYFWFWFSLVWLQICRNKQTNKKTMETKCTNSLE